MSNNTKDAKTKQEVLIAERDYRREKWYEEERALLQELEKVGFVADLKNFNELDLGNYEDLALYSHVIELQNRARELLEEKKLLWPEEWVVEELNKRHAVVHTGQTYILTEKPNPIFGGIDFTLESKRSFKDFYEDELVECFDGKKRSKANIWLKSTLKRKYTGIIFDPSVDPDKRPLKGNYNLWRGFAKQPLQGDASKYWDHVFVNICSRDEKTYRYVRKWMAYVFQHPDKVHTALVLCGSQGVGKNSFVEPLGVLLGSHYVLLSNISELVSNFNFHLKNAVLIHANEAFWGGHKKDIGALKAMITEETCLIEGKGKDRIMVRNYKHVIMSSNEDWPVHLDPDDRRFFVIRVSDEHKEDFAYFKSVKDQLLDGGYEALLWDLLNEDISDFYPRVMPDSTNAFDIKMLSANSAQRYVYAALYHGGFSIGENPEEYSSVWQPIIPKNHVYQDYAKWSVANGEGKLSKENFCKAFKRLIPASQNTRPGGAVRLYSFKFPALEQARADFCKIFKERTERIFDEGEV